MAAAAAAVSEDSDDDAPPPAAKPPKKRAGKPAAGKKAASTDPAWQNQMEILEQKIKPESGGHESGGFLGGSSRHDFTQ